MRKNIARNQPQQFLCDWVSVSQLHAETVPQRTKSVALIVESETAQVIGEAPRGFSHEGSHDSRILVTSYGNRVSLSGNIGRLNRPDNVFGYNIDECKRRCNEVMDSLGLPRFHDGQRLSIPAKRDRAGIVMYNGARFSRVDLTRNFTTGSEKNASDMLYWLASQRILRTSTTAEDNTVYYGRKSQYQTIKVYGKANELRAHLGASKKAVDNELLLYRQHLQRWAASVGLLRVELSMKRKMLDQKGLKHWATLNDTTATREYDNGIEKMEKRMIINDELENLKPNHRAIANAYMRGENLKDYGWSTATFYRHRRAILPTGIDIKATLNVRALSIQPRVIELRSVEVPEFYNNVARFAA